MIDAKTRRTLATAISLVANAKTRKAASGDAEFKIMTTGLVKSSIYSREAL